MNILFIINIDMSQSGPSVHLLNDIIIETKKRGHHVTRIEKKYGTRSGRIEHKEERDEEIFLCECESPRGMNYAKRYIADVKYARKCRSIAHGRHFDVIFVQSCNTAAFQLSWISKSTGASVYNVQDIFPLDMFYEGSIKKYNPVYVVMDILQKYAYRKSNRIITISNDMRQTLEELGVSDDKISVVHNWAFQSQYSPDEENEIFKTYFDNGKYNVIYAGNIGVAQSVETLIRAAALIKDHKDIHFQIFGAGSRKEHCIQLIDQLNPGNITFHDLVPQQYSQYVYHLADINIVTLISGIMRTSLPSKTAACYNSGKPVVYCIEKDSSTLRRMQNANRFIYQCNPENPELLAQCILTIYANRQENNCYEQCESYENVMIPQSAKEYVNIFETLELKK